MTKEQIIRVTKSFIKNRVRYPKLEDLETRGITRAVIRSNFTNIEGLIEASLDDSIVDVYRNLPINKINKQTLVLSTAVTGAKVDLDALKSVEVFCKKNNAQLVVLVSLADSRTSLLDPVLKSYPIIVSDTKLNNNLSIKGIKNMAKRADPVTGLPRIGQRNSSIILASPKQRLSFVPTGPSALPHALMSTGAITSPSYLTSSILTNQVDYMADNDHVMGGVIVELDKDKFHFRQIQFNKGSFVDLGVRYSSSGTKKEAPEAFVLGDLHSGQIDEVALKCWKDVTNLTGAKSWIIHDGFSGESVNPHKDKDIVAKAQMAMANQLSLESELTTFVKDIVDISKQVEVVIVKSNHDEFLDRWLKAGKYVEDGLNHRIALDLAIQVVDGNDPIKWYFNKLVSKTKNKVTWLRRDESYKVGGIELGQHGDVGANGARGSAVSMENAYGKCVYGHTHSPQINRNSWCVGTTSKLQLDYNRGASSWFHTSCLVYADGSRQMINSIEGKFTTRKV